MSLLGLLVAPREMATGHNITNNITNNTTETTTPMRTTRTVTTTTTTTITTRISTANFSRALRLQLHLQLHTCSTSIPAPGPTPSPFRQRQLLTRLSLAAVPARVSLLSCSLCASTGLDFDLALVVQYSMMQMTFSQWKTNSKGI